MNPRYYKAFQSQRSGARSRRIEWCLTYEEWLVWWGDDIERRGRGPDDLQMQRRNDIGPYTLGNISKGTPKQNAATAMAQSERRQNKYGLRVSIFGEFRPQKAWIDEVEPDTEHDPRGDDEAIGPHGVVSNFMMCPGFIPAIR